MIGLTWGTQLVTTEPISGASLRGSVVRSVRQLPAIRKIPDKCDSHDDAADSSACEKASVGGEADALCICRCRSDYGTEPMPATPTSMMSDLCMCLPHETGIQQKCRQPPEQDQ